MSVLYAYQPIHYFLATFILTWIPLFTAAYLSHHKGKEKLQLFLGLQSLLIPAAVAIVMLYASKNTALINDFWHRLTLFTVDTNSLITFMIIIPALFFTATAISLLFGKSTEQFTFATEANVLQGWRIFSLVIPIFLAPALEEIGWRGYGVDSLSAYFNLFYTSIIFGILWSLWHLPLFFIKGYYQYGLRENTAYVINFFVSIIPAAILSNWVYYNNFRSILIAIFAHAMLNAISILFKTEQFTKCIFTILLCILSAIIIFKDKEFFFDAQVNKITMHD